jgi:hypothetical protein
LHQALSVTCFALFAASAPILLVNYHFVFGNCSRCDYNKKYVATMIKIIQRTAFSRKPCNNIWSRHLLSSTIFLTILLVSLQGAVTKHSILAPQVVNFKVSSFSSILIIKWCCHSFVHGCLHLWFLLQYADFEEAQEEAIPCHSRR